MKIDFIKLAEKIKNPILRYQFLNTLLDKVIPFNKGLGLRILEINEEFVEVKSVKKKRRRNHLGGVHACALALLGEYPAGIFLAKVYPVNKYRLILAELNMTYLKQVHNTVYSRANRPQTLPKTVNQQGWAFMETQLMNSRRETVALCQTKWQIKEWDSLHRGVGSYATNPLKIIRDASRRRII